MATPAQIDEQVQLERDQIRQGLKRLRDNTDALQQRSYASATVYGVASIDMLLPILVKYIDDTTHDRLKRGTGYQFQLIKEYVSQLEPLAAGAIALKLTFDKVLVTRREVIRFNQYVMQLAQLLKMNVRCVTMSVVRLVF